jgi:poly(3-hydroxybutyrate) depolymerase
MTVEAEHDVVCGQGQTHAAQDLCTSLSQQLRQRLDQPGAGHFGLFHGTRWRTEIAPQVRRHFRRAELLLRTNHSRASESAADGVSAPG